KKNGEVGAGQASVSPEQSRSSLSACRWIHEPRVRRAERMRVTPMTEFHEDKLQKS
ncbi:hypothetical protein BDV25DRAFT_159400, partial [Aspergillus avenaceus]